MPAPGNPDFDEAARQVRDTYAEWQQRPIERHCTGIADCCRFRLAGHTPYLTKGEAIVAAFVHAQPEFTLERTQAWTPEHHQTDGFWLALLRRS